MADIMPRDPPNYRTFQTAGGGRWGRARRDRSYCQGYCRRDQGCSHSRHPSKISRYPGQHSCKYPRALSTIRWQ